MTHGVDCDCAFTPESRLKTRAERLEELVTLMTAWRGAKCSDPAGQRHPWDEIKCNGENHAADCPVEIARQDMTAAHDTLTQGQS